MSGLEARNEREDLVIPFLLQAASFLPLLIHKSLGASVGRQAVGGSEVEAAAGVCCCLRGQRRAAERAPYTHRGQRRPQQGFHLCLSQQKERQEKEGKFSPKQPEGRPLYELGIASGEHASSLDPRVQTCCVTQPARGGEEAACGSGSSSGCPRGHLRGLEGLSPGSTAWLRWSLVKRGHSPSTAPLHQQIAALASPPQSLHTLLGIKYNVGEGRDASTRSLLPLALAATCTFLFKLGWNNKAERLQRQEFCVVLLRLKALWLMHHAPLQPFPLK